MIESEFHHISWWVILINETMAVSKVAIEKNIPSTIKSTFRTVMQMLI